MSYTFKPFRGLKLIESLAMADVKQARKHRKKRINKKWLKKYGYIITPKKDVFVTGNAVIGHPDTLKEIIRLAEAEG